MTDKVRVYANPLRSQRAEKPWIVGCDFCAGDFFSYFGAYYGPGVKGHAPDWRTAQDYAQRHAAEHEATRCQSCLHVPRVPTPSEQKAGV